MGSILNGGTNTSVIGNTDAWVHTGSVPLPTGRNQMLDGSFSCAITALRANVGGKGATRNISLQIESVVGTGAVAVGAAGDGSGAIGIACTPTSVAGGTGVFRISGDGSFYFGRGTTNGNPGGTSTDSHGTSFSNSLASGMDYISAPTAPTAPAVSPASSTSAAVSWSGPLDNGDGTITGYRLDYSTDSSFATGVTSIETGPVPSYTVTGLTPGSTYYFRVFCENAATTARGSWSQPCSSVSLTMGSAPSAPTGVSALAFAGRLEVDWSAVAGSILSYTVELSTDNFATVLATFAGIAPTLTQKTIPALTPGTLYYARVKAVNSIGSSAASSVVSATIPARNAMTLVRSAVVDVSGGVQVEIRSDGANSPAINLGYTTLAAPTTFVTIANIPVNGGLAANHKADSGIASLALVADALGNLYVIGARADDGSTVLVKSFVRSATTAWAAAVSLSQALPNTGDPLAEFAGAFVAGSGGSPVDSIMLLARRVGTIGAGSLSYATLSTVAAQAGSGTLFVNSGSDPSFLGAPPSSGANTGLVDVALLAAGGQRVVLLGNSWAVVDVVNGAVTSVVKAADGAVITGVGWAQIMPISTTAFAVFAVASGGALTWAYFSTSGSSLGGGSVAAATAFGGAFADQWGAYPDVVANVVRVFYLDSTAGARSLSFFTVSPSTYGASAAVNLTAALGAAGSTNGSLRAVEGPVDERRVTITAANLLAGAKSTAAFSDTTGNVAPNAPSLVTFGGFDATQAFTLQWAPSDPNPQDIESAYEVQVQRVSDSVNVVATGSTAGSATSYVVAANTLANPVAYRWRVRTTDALGVVGAWSAYSAFTTAALGTLTITSPTPDNVAGINVTNVPLAWSYTQPTGYVQTSYRIVVTKTSDGSAVYDSGVITSTATSATIPGLASGVGVTATLSIVTNAPGTPTVTAVRLITPNYGQPDTPTIVVTPGTTSINLTVTNPTPTGSRPAVLRNDVYRRQSGIGAAWVRVAQIAANGTYQDHAVGSGVAYDYYVAAISVTAPQTAANSTTATATGPKLQGVWINDPTAPATSEANYLFANGRSEKREIATAKTKLQGRVNPLVEYGVQTEVGLTVSIPVPYDALHDAAVSYLRTLYENRRAFLYRDNRGRRQWSAIAEGGFSIADDAGGGSIVQFVATRIDFDESV